MIAAVKDVKDALAKMPGIVVDVRLCFAYPPNISDAEAQVPGVLIFLLSHFAKAWLSQCQSSLVSDTELAEPYGVFLSIFFASPETCWNGTPMVDLLLAKYHKVCPILFTGGLSGLETTQQGRKKLGWEQDDDGFVVPQKHAENMTGLGAGFAALSLRDFSRSQRKMPLPNYHYWAALSRILNTPPDHIQPTHLIVLKAMVENYVPKVILHFGSAGIAALRKALVDFPRASQAGSQAKVCLVGATALDAVRVNYEKTLHLMLAQ